MATAIDSSILAKKAKAKAKLQHSIHMESTKDSKNAAPSYTTWC